ncbi:MAG: hypothetical protein GY811_10545 [Myxococcales bacterium]|nr:hypothetical protein [Myxococcales bacterium]
MHSAGGRLVRGSPHIITIEGDSFRNPPKNKREAKNKVLKKAKEKKQ